MGVFAKPANQAEKAIAELHREKKVPSIGSAKSYKSSLKSFAEFSKENFRANLKTANPGHARLWLEQRSSQVTQKTLDRDRQAVNKWLEHRGHQDKIEKSEIKSTVDNSKGLAFQSRAYTNEQLDRIQARMPEHHRLAVEVGREAGLRAHETATIAPIKEQPPDERAWRNDRFRPDQTERYTVIGKGGLIREIRLTPETAKKLESARRPEPMKIRDRQIEYTSRYNIGHGQALSVSFSHHSRAEVGWSAGHHGIRHTYAQERIVELQKSGYRYNEAKQVVSQEVGHFSTKNTERYLV